MNKYIHGFLFFYKGFIYLFSNFIHTGKVFEVHIWRYYFFHFLRFSSVKNEFLKSFLSEQQALKKVQQAKCQMQNHTVSVIQQCQKIMNNIWLLYYV